MYIDVCRTLPPSWGRSRRSSSYRSQCRGRAGSTPAPETHGTRGHAPRQAPGPGPGRRGCPGSRGPAPGSAPASPPAARGTCPPSLSGYTAPHCCCLPDHAQWLLFFVESCYFSFHTLNDSFPKVSMSEMRNSTLTMSGCVLLAALVAGMYASSVISAVRGSYSEEGEIFLCIIISSYYCPGGGRGAKLWGKFWSGHQSRTPATQQTCHAAALGPAKLRVWCENSGNRDPLELSTGLREI